MQETTLALGHRNGVRDAPSQQSHPQSDERISSLEHGWQATGLTHREIELAHHIQGSGHVCSEQTAPYPGTRMPLPVRQLGYRRSRRIY